MSLLPRTILHSDSEHLPLRLLVGTVCIEHFCMAGPVLNVDWHHAGLQTTDLLPSGGLKL